MSAAMPGPPAPPAGHPAPPLLRPELPDGVEPTPLGPRWAAWTAWVALIGGFAAAIAAAIVIGIGAAAFGAALDSPPPSVNILATVAQDLCLIGAAILAARLAAPPRPRDFGLRPTAFWPGLGWVGVLLISFVTFTAAWVALLGISNTDETLPKQLGVDESTVALVAVTILVCVIAPLAEEFFFRGYFFTALRSWRGVWPAALLTGLVFGAVHAGSSNAGFLVPLGLLGMGLCLLYVRTGSLYPCIAAHALNNSIAFGASQHWGWEIAPLIVASLGSLAAILALVTRLGRMPGAAAARA
jgi:membrane protease YdiL (CAAX protease family)